MALKLLQPGVQPLGQFDCQDALLPTLKGGEVLTFKGTPLATADKAAKDSFDGYINPSSRVFAALPTAGANRPLMLCDDGIAGYGTLFGTVVGGTVGQVSTGGAVLGPHTGTGSGKVTLWEKPGVYAVSLDACDTDSAAGLQPTNTSLAAGAGLYVTSAGLLTPTTSRALSTDASSLCGRFIDFETSGSLVNTPNRLVGTLSTPDGASSAGTVTYSFAVFYFHPSV